MLHAVKLFILVTVLCSAAPSFAQDARLIEPAKKDGRVVLYGTMQSDIFDLLQKAFHKRTGITIDYWRGSSTKVMERAMTSIARTSRSSTSSCPPRTRCASCSKKG